MIFKGFKMSIISSSVTILFLILFFYICLIDFYLALLKVASVLQTLICDLLFTIKDNQCVLFLDWHIWTVKTYKDKIAIDNVLEANTYLQDLIIPHTFHLPVKKVCKMILDIMENYFLE